MSSELCNKHTIPCALADFERSVAMWSHAARSRSLAKRIRERVYLIVVRRYYRAYDPDGDGRMQLYSYRYSY